MDIQDSVAVGDRPVPRNNVYASFHPLDVAIWSFCLIKKTETSKHWLNMSGGVILGVTGAMPVAIASNIVGFPIFSIYFTS